MNTPTINNEIYRIRLQTHFAMSGIPFRKSVKASMMFDSQCQRELVHALLMWTEVRGLALVHGKTGVGKSISLRKFALRLPTDRFKVIRFSQLPTTPSGFLRSLCRVLEIPTRHRVTDMFDQVRIHLHEFEDQTGQHPVLICDDAEGMRLETLDMLRRLMASDLDSTDSFSILLSGTDAFVHSLQKSSFVSLCSRFTFVQQLRPFGLDDSINYIRFHVEGSGGRADLFTEQAVRQLFQASQGAPRAINQLAIQALIIAAVRGVERIDERLMKSMLATHPMYQRTER